MRNQHAPYSRNHPIICSAIERASALGADGVLSGFRLIGQEESVCRQAAGFAFARKGFQDETPIHTSSIAVIGEDEITTSNGSRYLIADYLDDGKLQLAALKATLRKNGRRAAKR